MRLKTIPTKQTLQEVAQEFLSFKCAQKVREQTKKRLQRDLAKILQKVYNIFTTEQTGACIQAERKV